MGNDLLSRLRIADGQSGVANGQWCEAGGDVLVSYSPADGAPIGSVKTATREDYDRLVLAAQQAFLEWRRWPAPQRGEIVRQIGNALRDSKDDLGELVTLEVGKIRSEGLGEVQEMIDMCDYAVGLSRQLFGLTIASERPQHRMFEQWHPLGTVGVITAFNFPVAVWAWNAMVAAACGDTVIWKPSPQAPMTSLAVQQIVHDVLKPHDLEGVFNLCVTSGIEAGEWIAGDERLPLVSATGSCAMGRSVARTVADRLGRSLLELGGNNAVVLTPSADLDLAVRAIVFAAVGTAGQRCTSLRRLIVHESIVDDVTARLVRAYQSISVGQPLLDGTLMGPLINAHAVDQMLAAIEQATAEGGQLRCGGERLDLPGHYVTPAIIRGESDMKIIEKETFAPILYVVPYATFDEAVAIQNAVPQGLSSAVFTDSVREAEMFLSATGSDCGIANVNIGTSGAEIGGAFGGEKETGGGREAGSDSWKAYMRRQTCTVNFGSELPLAQGVEFNLDDA